VSARARELGLTLLQPARVRSDESLAVLCVLAPDLILLADYGQIIPHALLELPPRGFLNLHPSALPRHRGAAPIPATILAGDLVSAVSLIILTEELDAGPIVASAPLAVRDDDTAVSLEERAAAVGAELIRRSLRDWLAGRLTPHAQATIGVTLTRPLRRAQGLLDPSLGALVLARQVRAYQPWPGSFLETTAGHLIVWRACVEESLPDDAVGEIVATSNGGLALATSAGRLVLEELQLAGGRAMSGAQLRRGHSRLTLP